MGITKVLILLSIQEILKRGNVAAEACPSYCSHIFVNVPSYGVCSECTKEELCPTRTCTGTMISYYYDHCIKCGFSRAEMCKNCWSRNRNGLNPSLCGPCINTTPTGKTVSSPTTPNTDLQSSESSFLTTPRPFATYQPFFLTTPRPFATYQPFFLTTPRPFATYLPFFLTTLPPPKEDSTTYNSSWLIWGPIIAIIRFLAFSYTLWILYMCYCWKKSSEVAESNSTMREEERIPSAPKTTEITSVRVEVEGLPKYEHLFSCNNAGFDAPSYPPPRYDDVISYHV